MEMMVLSCLDISLIILYISMGWFNGNSWLRLIEYQIGRLGTWRPRIKWIQSKSNVEYFIWWSFLPLRFHGANISLSLSVCLDGLEIDKNSILSLLLHLKNLCVRPCRSIWLLFRVIANDQSNITSSITVFPTRPWILRATLPSHKNIEY